MADFFFKKTFFGGGGVTEEFKSGDGKWETYGEARHYYTQNHCLMFLNKYINIVLLWQCFVISFDLRMVLKSPFGTIPNSLKSYL